MKNMFTIYDPTYKIQNLEEIEKINSSEELYNFIWNIFKTYKDEIFAFCPKCGDKRRMQIELKHYDGSNNDYRHSMGASISEPSIPSTKRKEIPVSRFPIILKCTCLQCNSQIIVLIYLDSEKKLKYVFLYDTYTGAITPNTPEEVKYYLNEAFKCRSIGAYSATVTMYRSALEWLMYLNGYEDGLLGRKLSMFFEDIKNNKAPKWAYNIPSNILTVIKDFGNKSIHTNKGDISIQNKMNIDLVQKIDLAFKFILELAYEQPHRLKELSEQFDKI